MQLKPTTILVTGGCGYLGSQLIRDLTANAEADGVTVRILDNMQSGELRALMDLPNKGRYQFFEGDVLDPTILRMALEGVDKVVHLASVVRTPLSFENPTWMGQVNHWGTAHLVEACLEANVQHFVYTSTTAVYGADGPHAEKDRCRPQGPYALSKYEAEKSVITARERGLSTTILRLGTLFGDAPVTRFDAVANRFAYLAGVQRRLTIYGDGLQKRPLVHVRDASSAVQYLLQNPDQEGGIFNVVGINASILDLVDAIREIQPDIATHYTEQDIRTHFSFDVSGDKLKQLGWSPRVSLEAGFAEMIGRFTNLTKMPTLSSEMDEE